MKTKHNVKIAFSHVVKTLKEHVNIGPSHATKISRYSAEILQTFFENKINQEAHEISDLASRIAHENGRRTIRPQDMDHAIELLNPPKQDNDGDIKLMELKIKRFDGTQKMTVSIYYDPQADLSGAMAFMAYLDHNTRPSTVKTFAQISLKELISTIQRSYEIVGYTPILKIDENILTARGVVSC